MKGKLRIWIPDRGKPVIVSSRKGVAIEPQVEIIAEGLAKLGNEVTVVCYKSNSSSMPFHVRGIPPPLGHRGIGEASTIYFAMKAALLLFKERRSFDVVYFHGSNFVAFIYSLFTSLTKSADNPAVVFSLAPPSSRLNRQSRILPRVWYRNVMRGFVGVRLLMWVVLRRVITFSSAVLVLNRKSEIQLAHYFGNRSKMRIMQYNQVDTSLFSPSGPKPPEGFIVLTVARMEPRKNHMAILRAASLLIGKGIRFRFVGPEEKSYKSELQKYVETHNMKEMVEFVGYVDSYEELAQIYRQADIYVLLSTDETGVPTTIAQALSSGLPTILSMNFADETDLRGVSLFVEAEDEREVAKLILELRNNESLRNRMAITARKIALERFDSRVAAMNLEAILMEVFKKCRRA